MARTLNPTKKRHHSRGQAIVETALAGLLLALLLAAAVDFGRAYYTSVVVENMAGEGVAYVARYPERDLASPDCAAGQVFPNLNVQDRARRVAADRGMIIRQPSQADVRIAPADCRFRCEGITATVTITYHINDLLLPRLIGMNEITIRKSATQRILKDVPGWTCP